MYTGTHSIRDLLVNRDVDQIIIPEIQRDYVWGENQVKNLLEDIEDAFCGYLKFGDGEEIPEYVKKQKCDFNIGFIYAYSDIEYGGKFFLIDGQQRLTTMYLTLLTLASQDKELGEKFKRYYFSDNKPKIDYRVRDATQEFLSKFTQLILSNKDENVKEQLWYLKEYEGDITIQSLLDNHETIKQIIESNKNATSPSKLFDFIENLVTVWYFDTGKSAQGESLYIYMNARGEALQGNENVKADLLGKLTTDEDKNDYGEQWEAWQDFFWKHKNAKPNENADKGFNGFLSCISGLENYLKDKKDFLDQKIFEDRGMPTKRILEGTDLENIKKYVRCLEIIDEKKDAFKSKYNYNDWVDESIKLIWKLLNGDSPTNWHANYGDTNRSKEQRIMPYLWSILYYLGETDLKNLDERKFFRALRVFYLRYHNNIKAVGSVQSFIKGIVGLTTIEMSISEASDEEKKKASLLHQHRGDEASQRQIEEIIWEIEDHPRNLGTDVGAINISHLIDITTATTLKELVNVKDTFYKIFPLDKGNPSKKHDSIAQSILLYYGEYWEAKWAAGYYHRLKFNEWKYIIRDIYARKVAKDNSAIFQGPFRKFFNEFSQETMTLRKFLNMKQRDNPINRHKAGGDIRLELLWYSQNIDIDKMFERNIGIFYKQDGKPVPFSEKMFCTITKITENTKVYLFSKLNKTIQEQIKQEEEESQGVTTS